MNQPPLSILIVGASGFIGRHLVQRFATDGWKVEAWSRSPVDAPEGAEGRLLFRRVDLLDPSPLPAPPKGGWDAVFQLAGKSRPGQFSRYMDLRDTVRIGARVANHVCEQSPGARYFLNSSAYVYSASPKAQDESAPTEPSGPYGLAKLLAEDVTQLHSDRMHVTIVRPFNLIGAGMPQGLFATDLLERLRSGSGALELATPDRERDLLDIRDAVRAYVALLSADYASGTAFNLCSGYATRPSVLAAEMLNALGIQREVRFSEVPATPILGRCERLRRVANWEPKCSISDAAHNLVDAQPA